MTTIHETARLSVRHFTADDAPFIVRLLNDPSFIANIGDRGVRTVEDAADYLERGPIASYAAHGHGLYLVALKESGGPVGMCGLLRREQFDDADIGYAFLPEFRGRGYALESAAAVLDYGRRTLGLTRVLAIVSPGNTDSVKVLRKLGFEYDRTIPFGVDGADVEVYASEG
ncbi:MAG TPA: GNAT family N-acetyltransferase [Longimicrobium sp.]